MLIKLQMSTIGDRPNIKCSLDSNPIPYHPLLFLCNIFEIQFFTLIDKLMQGYLHHLLLQPSINIFVDIHKHSHGGVKH